MQNILQIVRSEPSTGVSWELLSFNKDNLVGRLEEKKRESAKPVNSNPVNGKKVQLCQNFLPTLPLVAVCGECSPKALINPTSTVVFISPSGH